MKYKIRYTIMALFFTGVLGWAMVDVAENPQVSATTGKHPTIRSISIRHLMAPATPVAKADSGDIPPGTNPPNYYGSINSNTPLISTTTPATEATSSQPATNSTSTQPATTSNRTQPSPPRGKTPRHDKNL